MKTTYNKRGFLKSISISSLAIFGSFSSLFAKDKKREDQVQQLRNELEAAWTKSEKYSLEIIEQMPDALFGFKYTPEAMSYAEQWRHCAVFTLGQIAGRLKMENPYEKAKPKVDLNKAETITEVKKMYAFVQKAIQETPPEKLYEKTDFAGEVPIWRLLYAMENHIIHHRGQCIVYLRLKGITPKGYFGW
jgi:hypothetical protein